VLLFVLILQHLRQTGVVGKFVEFFGPGVAHLSIADRATIANMCPEYGATVGFFPVDEKSLLYLRQTGKIFVLLVLIINVDQIKYQDLAGNSRLNLSFCDMLARRAV